VASGKAMAEIMDDHPRAELLVLCGHTHGAGAVQVAPNLRVLTGGAEYGAPAPQPLLDW